MSDTEAPGFHVASEQEIKAGKVTDIYFARTVEVLRREGVRKHVLAEVRVEPAARLPVGGAGRGRGAGRADRRAAGEGDVPGGFCTTL